VNEEIDHALLESFLLLRTIVTVICNMGEKVLPTVQALSEIAKTWAEREGELTMRPLETRTLKPKIMVRETGGGGEGVQVTGSAGVVGGDDQFS